MNKKGVSFAEYVILIGILLVSLTAMSTYIKRGIQARLKDTADGVLLSDLTGRTVAGTDWPAHQYIALQNESDFTTISSSVTNVSIAGNTENKDAIQSSGKTGTEWAVTEGFEDLLP